MKKVLHLLYSGLGGHGNVFFSFINAGNGGFVNEALFNGIEEVREEYIQRCKELNIKYSYVRKMPGLDLNYYRQIYNIIRDSRCDIIFLHTSTYILPAFIAKWLTGGNKKIIIRETQANHLKTMIEWVWLSIGLLLAHKIVFLSEAYNAEVAETLKWLYRRKKVVIIPNGIDLNKFEPSPKESSGFTIGMQSRIVKIKDYPTLLKAFAIVKHTPRLKDKHITLRIAGEGDMKGELQALSETLGISGDVTFEGLLGERELVRFLQSLDLYIHASLGETMSTAIMQAMACGLPIIASDVKGINNMVFHNENGLLYSPQDERILANLIIQCIEDGNLRMGIATSAQQYAFEHFSNKRMYNSYNKLITVLNA